MHWGLGDQYQTRQTLAKKSIVLNIKHKINAKKSESKRIIYKKMSIDSNEYKQNIKLDSIRFVL